MIILEYFVVLTDLRALCDANVNLAEDWSPLVQKVIMIDKSVICEL